MDRESVRTISTLIIRGLRAAYLSIAKKENGWKWAIEEKNSDLVKLLLRNWLAESWKAMLEPKTTQNPKASIMSLRLDNLQAHLQYESLTKLFSHLLNIGVTADAQFRKVAKKMFPDIDFEAALHIVSLALQHTLFKILQDNNNNNNK